MKSMKGYVFFFLVLAIILIAVLSNDFFSGMNQESYTYSDFKKEITDKKVASVTIQQNEQVPTGRIVVTPVDSKKKSFY